MIFAFLKTADHSPLLVVGLGNPGKEYVGTRHNAGADAVRLVAKRAELSFEHKRKLFAEISEGSIGKRRVILARPTTLMNQSGKAINALAQFYRIPSARIIVTHDDMDLPFGSIKIVFHRGSGGHKGVESVFRALRSKEITRVRIGTMGSGRAQKPGRRELENIVVKPLRIDEKALFAKGVRKAADALEILITEGQGKAMNQIN